MVLYLAVKLALLLRPDLQERLLGTLSGPELLALSAVGFNFVFVGAAYLRSLGRGPSAVLLESTLIYAWLLLVFMAADTLGLTPSLDDIAASLVVLGPLSYLVLRSRGAAGTAARHVWKGFKDALLGAFRFASVAAVNGIVIWLPVVALGFSGQLQDVANYNAAYRIAMMVGIFGVIVKSSTISTYLSSHAADDQLKPAAVLRGSATAMAALAVLAGVLWWQKELLASIFGDEFTQVGTILPIMLVGQVVNSAGFLPETLAVLHHKTNGLNWVAALTLATASIAIPVLVYYEGIIGAALAFSITTVVNRLSLVALLVCFSRATEI
ncbi:hypothetical protein QWJ41_19635 [Nocardioides sp. SOB44]|uniref:Polysaccharide biosynthesis protein C-terminal domain-containing protein n=1 Tax=Nocardioides cremeus TaxID=3058044 RepID=A0ABT8TVF7_9ACTN|nr:hypothetical protein [Nocardioides cremeus]MDO3397944.1 hypothetical protein [Nocardioides cremeus]